MTARYHMLKLKKKLLAEFKAETGEDHVNKRKFEAFLAKRDVIENPREETNTIGSGWQIQFKKSSTGHIFLSPVEFTQRSLSGVTISESSFMASGPLEKPPTK